MRFLFALLLAAPAAPAWGQAGPYLAQVQAESVLLRGGPGEAMPETGAAYRGNYLTVVREEGDGWLAVEPPRGQVSWVKGIHLETAEGQRGDAVPRNAVVHADPDAEVALGRPGYDRPLDVRRARVPDGTIVLVIGPKVEVGGQKWYPIAPPDGDYRYVPRSAVKLLRGEAARAWVVQANDPPAKPLAPAAPPPAASIPAVGASPVIPASTAVPAPPAERGGASHPLWVQADDAERAGDYARAEKLYLRLASELNRDGGDEELSRLCYTRVHAVREKARTAGRTTARPAARERDADRDERPRGRGEWFGPGTLREATFRYDRRPTFALVSGRNRPLIYAVAAEGVDLERYLREDVELYGTVLAPGDEERPGMMSVTEVRRMR